MLKPIPCKKCGTARLHNREALYLVGRVPLLLKYPGRVLTTKCFCGTVNKLTRAEFDLLPNLDAKGTDAKA